MATFFGEVLPVFSRAVDEDDDEDDDEIPPYIGRDIVLKWEQRAANEFDKSGDKLRLKCKVLVVAIGPIPCGFVRARLLPKQDSLLGMLTHEERPVNDNDGLQRKSKLMVAGEFHMSSFSKDTVFCLNNESLPPESAYQFTQLIFHNVYASDIEVAILHSRHVAEYQSLAATSALSTPFLRLLKSSAFNFTTACSCLEQPNTVSGVAAAVLTHCQIKNIPAVMYISYTDVMDIDSVNMFIFKPILKFKPFHNVVHENPREDQCLPDVNKLKTDHGNLYL